MIDWVIVVAAFVAAMAGAIGGSARPGEGLRDIPKVFMRKPGTLVASALGASIVVVIVQTLSV